MEIENEIEIYLFIVYIICLLNLESSNLRYALCELYFFN